MDGNPRKPPESYNEFLARTFGFTADNVFSSETFRNAVLGIAGALLARSILDTTFTLTIEGKVRPIGFPVPAATPPDPSTSRDYRSSWDS